ncbi:MAG: DNA-processing protein DprA [Muribaculaceae bacterium]
MNDNRDRRIAFSMAKGINYATANELCRRLGSVDRLFDAPLDEIWAAVGAKKPFADESARRALICRAEAERNFIEKNHIRTLFFTDDDYPHRLTMCDDAPAMLYSLGNCDLNSNHIISIVGTRRSTPYGNSITERIIGDLADALPSLVVVSGLAYGIDVAAHRAALACKVPTVAVVAHGLNTIYPADHRDVAARIVREGGAIVTEYPSDSAMHRGNFLARNRIVAGMSDIVLIVESDEKGGSMVTASIAQGYGREVGAIPGRTTDRYSRGPNRLIHDNAAVMIRDASDIIELMNWAVRRPEGTQNTLPFAEISPEAKPVVDYLRNNPDATVNEMTTYLGIPFKTLSALLMEMEMDDLIDSIPGGRFMLKV